MSTTFLDITTATTQLADAWDVLAKAYRRYDEGDPKAKVLERCATELRGIATKNAPEWVPLGVVIATSGIARTTLLRRCKELEGEGRARKRGERWELTLDVALELARRSERPEISDVTDIDELAKVLGQEPER